MKFLVTIYRDGDGFYTAECPSIPGCVSQGTTEAEAEANLAEAIRECVAARTAQGLPPSTVNIREIEVAI